jgi:enoyl-CoA hydratase
MSAPAETPTPSLSLEIRPDQAAVVTIDQPNSRANVLSSPLWAELAAMLSRLHARADLKGLILRSGKPGMFIAGADLNELANASPDNPGPTRAFIEQGLAVLATLEALPFPTVALVDGYCLGGGLEVALACDFRIAGTHPNAKFGMPELTLGLIPGWGGTQRLPRLIGIGRTIEMIQGNLQYDAETAKKAGLVESIVPPEELVDAGARLLEEARRSGTWRLERDRKQRPLVIVGEEFAAARRQVTEQMGNASTKRAALELLDVMERGCRLPLNDGISLETEAFVRLATTPEARQLVADFFAKRRK